MVMQIVYVYLFIGILFLPEEEQLSWECMCCVVYEYRKFPTSFVFSFYLSEFSFTNLSGFSFKWFNDLYLKVTWLNCVLYIRQAGLNQPL